MVKMLSRIWPGAMLVVACFVFTLVLVASGFAQDVPLELPAAADQVQAAVLAAFAALLPFAVEILKKFIPGMPRMLIWAAAPVLGAAIGWVTGIGGMTGWKGFAAGLAAIALREFQSTFKQHGVNG
jgi:ABC-type glycerol-3-phosphate transport system permease component